MVVPCSVRRPLFLALVGSALALALVPAGASEPVPDGTTSVFASVPAPGHADTSLIAPDGTVLVSTNRGATGSTGPSVVLRYARDGHLLRRYAVTGQDVAGDHGLMGMALDAAGRLYVADYSPPRVLRLDLVTGRQSTYATIPDLPRCATAAPGCDNGLPGGPRDNAQPWPDGLAFLPDGRLLVSDLGQGTVFTVASGGGAGTVWLQGPELTSTFGPNNLVLDRKGGLLLDVTASTVPATAGRGVLYRLPLVGGRPGPLTQVYATRPGEGPDGFALGTSGRVYLCTLVTDTLIVVGPDGQESVRYQRTPTDAVPFDSPSSATFDGTSLLVTNLTYFTGRTSNDLVLRVAINDRGVAAYRPAVRR